MTARRLKGPLADYIVRKYEVPKGPCDPNQMSIARALEIYGNERAPQLAAPKLVGYHIEPLVAFWGDQPVGAIKGETCRAYVHFRTDPRKGEKKRTVKSGTARRELETLGAAINFCHKEGHLTHVPRVTFPKKTKGKTRWLTRNEAARLLWAARRVPHLRTFILIGLYTGTRSTAILGLQWIASLEGGWIDLDRGILYRGADGRVETNKRQPPCSIPHKLIAHLRRARKRTRRFAVEYDGESHKAAAIVAICLRIRRSRHRCDAAYSTTHRRDLALAESDSPA